MKKFCIIRANLIAALLVVVLIVTSASCTKDVFTPPAASNPDDAPLEVTARQIWDDYKADPIAADAKYSGKKLHFARVQVDQMPYLGEGRDPELYVQEGIEPGVFAVKFHTWYEVDIMYCREGHIVEIVGYSEGYKNNYVNIRIEWIRSIDPPNPTEPPDEY